MNFPHLKEKTIENLLQLEAIGNDLKSPEKVKFVQAGVKKLEENKFTIVIAGEFSRGKTTLLKALTGGLEYLPDANQANTSAITVVEYSNDPEDLDYFKVVYRDDREDKKFPKTEIRKFVEQDPQVHNAEIDEVERIHIWSDLPYLKDGIQIVDSPGLGSIYPHHRQITYDQIAESDACIFLMLIRPAAGASEISFLKDIQRHLNKVFFVLNQCDIDDLLKKPDILKAEVEKIAAQLETQDIKGFKAEHLFPMSTQWAFAGKAKEKADSILKQRDIPNWKEYLETVNVKDFETLYKLSGFDPFEKFFEAFVYSGEKAREILMAPIKRIQNCSQEFADYIELRLIHLNDDVSVEELKEKIELIQGRLDLFKDRSEDTLKETEIKFEDLIKAAERQSEQQFDRARTRIKDEVQRQATSFDQLNNASIHESVETKITREVNKVIANLVDLIQVGIDDLIVAQQKKDQARLADILDNIESDMNIKIPKIELPKVYFNASVLEEFDRRIATQLKEQEKLEKNSKEAKAEEKSAKKQFEEKQGEVLSVHKDVKKTEESITDLRDDMPIFKQWQVKEVIDTIDEPYNHTYIEQKKLGFRLKFWAHKVQRTETRTRKVKVYGFETYDNSEEIKSFKKEIKKEKDKLRKFQEKLEELYKNAKSKEEQLKLKQEAREKLEFAQNKVNATIKGLELKRQEKEKELKEQERKRFMSESTEMIDEMVDSQVKFGKREIRKNVRNYYLAFKTGISTQYEEQINQLENELKQLLKDKNLQEEEKGNLTNLLKEKLEAINDLQQKTTAIENSILDHQAVA